MAFVLNLHMKNLSNDTLSTIKQLVDMLLSVITYNAKTEAHELNSNLEKKSE